jgi:hypothetical protein
MVLHKFSEGRTLYILVFPGRVQDHLRFWFSAITVYSGVWFNAPLNRWFTTEGSRPAPAQTPGRSIPRGAFEGINMITPGE